MVFKYSQLENRRASRTRITDGYAAPRRDATRRGGEREGFRNVLLHIHACTSHYYLRARARQNGEESRIQKDRSLPAATLLRRRRLLGARGT